MTISIPDHHSLTDWDFQRGVLYMALDPLHYVSSPSSLKLQNPNATPILNTVLCNLPATLNLPNGELITWELSTTASVRILSFRNQAPVGSANYDNDYEIAVYTSSASLYRNVAGVLTTIGSFVTSHLENVWYHWRVRFWTGINPAGAIALNVMLFKDVAGSWVQQTPTLYDTANYFAATGKARMGLIANSRDNIRQNFDDTEIWG